MKLDDFLKSVGGVVGLGAIGVTGYFIFRYAVWPHLNSEDGDEPVLPMPTPPNELPEVIVKDDVVNNAGLEAGQKFVEGWKWGIPRTIVVEQVEPGFWLDPAAAEHYVMLRDEAKAEGVTLKINDAYRTMAQQQVQWDKYQAKLAAWRNSGRIGKEPTPAAKPGRSNHQMGLALDIESANGTNAAFHWLTANAHRHKFKRTVSNEPWHWEYVA